MDGVRLRRLEMQDVDFLHDMMVQAFYWREVNPTEPLTSLNDIREIAKYIGEWGRHGDAGVVAESGAGERLGAAWYRLFTQSDHGYDFVSPEIPELGIAVKAGNRERGVGRLLMNGLLELAAEEGHRGLSLSVDDDNVRATQLYDRLGFTRVNRVGSAWTMLLKLVAKRTAEGRTKAEIFRCLKRYVAREVFKLLVIPVCRVEEPEAA